MQLRKAERKHAKIKMGLQGPSGSGKTYSSLLIAYGLCEDWTKIAVIDTEQGSADLYSVLGPYQVLQLNAPYSPERYISAIEECERAGIEIIIIDSISHEWEGAGGILETHSNMTGNSFTNWAKLTPRHNAFIQKILSSQCHIICTMRVKQDYVLNLKDGKYVPEKTGLKGITREGMDYELTLVLELDIKHNCSASKDRTQLFMDKPEFKITEATGKRIKNWCNSGISDEELCKMILRTENMDDLRTLYHNYPQDQQSLSRQFATRKAELEKNPINKPLKQHHNGNTIS